MVARVLASPPLKNVFILLDLHLHIIDVFYLTNLATLEKFHLSLNELIYEISFLFKRGVRTIDHPFYLVNRFMSVLKFSLTDNLL